MGSPFNKEPTPLLPQTPSPKPGRSQAKVPGATWGPVTCSTFFAGRKYAPVTSGGLRAEKALQGLEAGGGGRLLVKFERGGGGEIWAWVGGGGRFFFFWGGEDVWSKRAGGLRFQKKERPAQLKLLLMTHWTSWDKRVASL